MLCDDRRHRRARCSRLGARAARSRWLFAARVLAGAFAANIGVASAYIADVTPAEERTRWMGMLGASFGVGFVLGPAIGGALAPFGYQVPMLVAAGLAAANFVHAARLAARAPGHARAGGRRRTARGALRDPLVRRLCVANFAFSVGGDAARDDLRLFMMDRFGYDARARARSCSARWRS